MARYIDADKLLEILNEELLYESSMFSQEQEEYLRRGLRIAINDVKRFPAVDVVPKSEVEELTRILNSYALQYGTVRDQQKVIDQAKTEVAREIFAEVEMLILDNTYPDFNVKHKPINVWKAQEGYDALAELKKEYTGGGSDKCCEDCKFYNTYRKDQPCCSCYDYINFESDVEGEP